MKIRTPAGLAAGLVSAALLAAPAAAAPVTVDLRIEGPSRTLFEGPVTTDVRPFQFTGDPATHRCDGTTTGGTSPQPVPTRGAAVVASSVAITGSWFDAFGAELLDGRGRVRRVRCRHGALSGRVQER